MKGGKDSLNGTKMLKGRGEEKERKAKEETGGEGSREVMETWWPS